jgi:hypothetical protein
MEPIEELICSSFRSCRARDDTELELMVILELARLMGETKKEGENGK